MNIFAVEEDPIAAAQALPDKLVVKMPIESAQMLAQWAYHFHNRRLLRADGDSYKITKSLTNHPCTKWLFEHPGNVSWLYEHALELCWEYTRRYGKTHATEKTLSSVGPLVMSSGNYADHTPFALCMPSEYKIMSTPVECYRMYMMMNKAGYATWKHEGRKPDWWDEGIVALAQNFLNPVVF